MGDTILNKEIVTICNVFLVQKISEPLNKSVANKEAGHYFFREKSIV